MHKVEPLSTSLTPAFKSKLGNVWNRTGRSGQCVGVWLTVGRSGQCVGVWLTVGRSGQCVGVWLTVGRSGQCVGVWLTVGRSGQCVGVWLTVGRSGQCVRSVVDCWSERAVCGMWLTVGGTGGVEGVDCWSERAVCGSVVDCWSERAVCGSVVDCWSERAVCGSVVDCWSERAVCGVWLTVGRSRAVCGSVVDCWSERAVCGDRDCRSECVVKIEDRIKNPTISWIKMFSYGYHQQTRRSNTRSRSITRRFPVQLKRHYPSINEATTFPLPKSIFHQHELSWIKKFPYGWQDSMAV
ncbi:hypothetical protein HNY73_006953 [Argiope bruennichi]|uniref:Uncharacterized protein n=1 Tax=Argiope bruennichi TaxID=94029 RepID=A0A8T0FHJ8_ARGBR|nr:hypothetical protein HNY73_006953 [Argiope bruennichi]